jgi:hypothetical protein
MGVGIRPVTLSKELVWNGPGERWKESVISKSSEWMAISDIWVACEVVNSSGSFMYGEGDPLCVRVAVEGDEYGEKKDFGSVLVSLSLSSESECTGVIVGGTGCEVKCVFQEKIGEVCVFVDVR